MSTAPYVGKGRQSSFQIFYEQSCWQIVLFSILSGGLYQFAWTYRFWRHFKRNALNGNALYPKDAKVVPVISALICHFYLYGACRRIELQLRTNGYARFRLHGWLCFFVFVGVPAASSIATFYGFSQLLSLLIDLLATTSALVWVQSKANIANRITGQCKLPSPLSKKDFLWGIFGFLIVLGLIVGDEDPESIYAECMRVMSSSEFSIKDQQSYCKCTQAQFNQYVGADPEKVMNYCLFDLPRS